MSVERDYDEGYFFEEQHVYVYAAWRAFGTPMSCAADEIQDCLTTERLRSLEA